MIATKLIGPGQRPQIKAEQGLMVLGVALRDAREEHFILMVCDGLPMGLAFKRAGFESKAHDAPANLFNLPRVQQRAAAILEARRTTGVVTLGEVTNMLQRVFAGAHSEGEYSAAHNAAFSLARLYGHVNDKSTLEIIRRPSRDPDAPSEQMLEDWAASLPVVSPEALEQASKAALPRTPAELLGPGPSRLSGPEPQPVVDNPTYTQAPIGDQQSKQYQQLSTRDQEMAHPVIAGQLDLFDGFQGTTTAGEGPGEFGNEAPVGPVTGTPNSRGHSPLSEKGAPVEKTQVTPTIGEKSQNKKFPPMSEIF